MITHVAEKILRVLGRSVGGVLLLGGVSILFEGPGWMDGYLSVVSIDTAHSLGRWIEAVLSGPLVAAEIVVGLGMALEGGRKWLLAGFLLLMALTLALLVRGVTDGWTVQCSCLSVILEGSVGGGLIRNGALMALVGAAWARGCSCATKLRSSGE